MNIEIIEGTVVKIELDAEDFEYSKSVEPPAIYFSIYDVIRMKTQNRYTSFKGIAHEMSVDITLKGSESVSIAFKEVDVYHKFVSMIAKVLGEKSA